MHIHVQRATGEAKFWIDPEFELEQNHGVSGPLIAQARRYIRENEHAIRAAWEAHFGG